MINSQNSQNSHTLPTMADHTEQTGRPDQTRPADQTGWLRRQADRLPLYLALTAIALVWLGGAVWSFEEQTGFAKANGFTLPWLLPLVLDGMAFAMAAVAWAASLDARPAVFARAGTAVAVACSAASNATFAWERAGGDPQTVALAAGVPVIANVAFEVLLSEVRRQVLRRRGLPGPVAVAYPRLVRLALAPWDTFSTWRRLVLEATDPRAAFQTRPGPAARPPRSDTSQRTSEQATDQTISALPRSATVTPIRPPAPDQTGPAAAANAQRLADRYPDRIPGQKEVERDMSWGAERTRRALAALAAMRQTG